MNQNISLGNIYICNFRIYEKREDLKMKRNGVNRILITLASIFYVIILLFLIGQMVFEEGFPVWVVFLVSLIYWIVAIVLYKLLQWILDGFTKEQ